MGITQRVLQRTVNHLGRCSTHQLRAEAQRKRGIKLREYHKDLTWRMELVTPHILLHSLARRMFEHNAQLLELQ